MKKRGHGAALETGFENLQAQDAAAATRIAGMPVVRGVTTMMPFPVLVC
jgi:hypothetical protein